VLVDARPAAPPARPRRQVELVQTLDDREAGQGKLTLELKATARGLVPALEELVDPAVPGFTVEKTDDRGLSLAQMDAGGDAVAPVTERLWLLTLRPADGGEARAFAFPRPRAEDIQAAGPGGRGRWAAGSPAGRPSRGGAGGGPCPRPARPRPPTCCPARSRPSACSGCWSGCAAMSGWR
jgi:hypothetical protein